MKIIKMNFPKIAIVLAGGKGTRLRPITYEIPKSILPIQGKAIVEHIFDLLKKYDITDIYLSVGYLKDEIINYFGNGEKLGIDIKYIKEKEPLGTAGFLNLVKDKLKDSFIVSNGDELKDIDIGNMYEF